MEEEPGGLQFMRSQKSWTQLSKRTHTHTGSRAAISPPEVTHGADCPSGLLPA